MGLIIKQPNPGDKKNEFINRRLIKEITKSTREQSPSPPPESPDYSYVLGQIPSGSTNTYIAQYQPVILDGSYYWDPDVADTSFAHLNSRIAKCYTMAETSPVMRQWGIALDCITDTVAGRILMTGVCWLDTSTLGTLVSTATHINILQNALAQGYNGRATVLQRMSKPHTLVHLTNKITSMRGKTKTAGLTAGSEGKVWYMKPVSTGWEVTTIEIPAWTDIGNIAGDKDVLIEPVEGRWYVVKLC